MSRIFDALQRSEADRSGNSPSLAPDATELLRHAERRAASEWNGTPVEHKIAGNGVSSGSNGAPLALEKSGPRAVPHVEEKTRHALPAVFDEFKTLEVAVPPLGRLVSISDKDSPAAEAFRLLAVRLRHLRRDRQLKKLLVTSSIPQEGKSTCSANLACSLALRAQQHILLVEGDIRRPTLSQLFGLTPRAGLCEWLRGERSLTDIVCFLHGPGIWFVPAGSSPSNPLELLQSGKVATLVDQVAGLFDWVVIDSPPVLPLADTSVWSRLADGILLVTRQGTTEKRQLERAVEALEPQKLIGALLNSSTNAPHTDYYYSMRSDQS